MNASRNFFNGINFQSELNYSHVDKLRPYRIRNSLAYNFDKGALRFSMDNFSNGDWLAQLRFSSSLLWQPKVNRLHIDKSGYINSGAILAKVFIDDNANKKYDLGEQLLSGIRFSGHRHSQKQTSEDGQLLISHLSTRKNQTIKLSQGTLPDPFLYPLIDAVSVRPHSGYAQIIEFPVVFTSEVEGELSSAIEETIGKKVLLQAVNSERSYQAVVEYDGIFIFDRVLPGDYTLHFKGKELTNVTLAGGEFLQLGQIKSL